MLESYEVEVVGMGPTTYGSIATEVEAFVQAGGGLVAVAPYSEVGAQPLPPGFEVTITDSLWPGIPIEPPPLVEATTAGLTHPIMDGVSLGVDVNAIGVMPIDTLGTEWTLLAKSQDNPHVALAVGNYGAGRMVLSAISTVFEENGLRFMQQMVDWAGGDGSSTPVATPTVAPTTSPTPRPFTATDRTYLPLVAK